MKTLYEGLLDDMEDVLADADKMQDEYVINSWCANKLLCKYVKRKKGYILTGEYIVNNIDDTYTGPKILAVKGNITIADSQLTNLTPLFAEDCVVDGTLTIEHNPKLTSLRGCPNRCNTFILTGNKALKSLDVADTPIVRVNAYVSNNGKRWKKDEIEDKIHVFKHIFCSADVNESFINESFAAPQLKIVADQIKQHSADVENREDKFTLKQLSKIEWDNIRPSQITEIDTQDNPKAALSLARKYINGKLDGIIVLFNENGYIFGIICQKHLLKLDPSKIDPKYKDYFPNGRILKKNNYSFLGIRYSSSDLIEYCATSDHMMFIDYDIEDRINTMAKIRKRANDKSGAAALERGVEKPNSEVSDGHPRYYEKIADLNRYRYRRELYNRKLKN